MIEHLNSNPDELEFLHMLGDPTNLNTAQVWALSHVFRTHVEGKAREYSEDPIGKKAAMKSAKQIMKRSLLVPKLLGVNKLLIQKAMALGIDAASEYVSKKK